MPFNTAAEARKAHWHSRRHETRDAHDNAREAYRNRSVGRPKQRFNEDTNSWEKVS